MNAKNGQTPRIVTIVNEYGKLTAREGQSKGSRHEWSAAGLQVWIKGKFSDIEYSQAANIAMNTCLSMHIPAVSMRRVSRPNIRKASSETKSGRLF